MCLGDPYYSSSSILRWLNFSYLVFRPPSYLAHLVGALFYRIEMLLFIVSYRVITKLKTLVARAYVSLLLLLSAELVLISENLNPA